MKKRILIVASFPPPYHGMATATELLCNSEVKNHFQLSIINTNSSILKMQWKFNLKRIGQILCFWGVFLYKIIKNRPNLVYLTIAQSRFGFLKDCFFVVSAKAFRRKTVVHFHGGLFESTYRQANSLLKWLIAYLLGLNDAVIVLADSLKSLTKNIVKEERVWVIPNCVDQSLILSKSETVEVRWKINCQKQRPFTLLYFSNLIRSKGYFDVLKAARELKSYHFKFLFAGSWENEEERKEAEEFVKINQIRKSVDFMAPVLGHAKKELLMNSDVFILPTYYPLEGLPISLLEAMACGLSVITTRYRGIRDMISEGENGFFVPAQNPMAIAERIRFIYQDCELQLKIAQNNIEKINRNFTEQIFAQNFIELFNTVLQN